jgi:hypothetical protein
MHRSLQCHWAIYLKHVAVEATRRTAGRWHSAASTFFGPDGSRRYGPRQHSDQGCDLLHLQDMLSQVPTFEAGSNTFLVSHALDPTNTPHRLELRGIPSQPLKLLECQQYLKSAQLNQIPQNRPNNS